MLYIPYEYRRFFAPAFMVVLIFLVLGMVCLAADIGRADRIMLLFIQPSLSFISVGSWALVVCVGLSVILGLVWGGYLQMRDSWLRVIEVFAGVVSLTVMLYTGLMLQSLQAVPLWATPLLPLLFVLSSSSCGISIVVVVAQFSGAIKAFATTTRRLACADFLIVILEVIVLLVFLFTFLSSSFVGVAVPSGTEEAAASSIQRLLTGPDAWVFWGGFVGLGLVGTLFFETVFVRMHASTFPAVCAATVCVLVGGLALRYCIVEAGMQPLLVVTSFA